MLRRKFVKNVAAMAGSTYFIGKESLIFSPDRINFKGRDILSISEFTKKYLGFYCPLPFKDCQLELFGIIENLTLNNIGNRKVARAWPHGDGDITTLSVILPLWWFTYQLKKFIVLATGASQECYHEKFFDVLQVNNKLVNDFPHMSWRISAAGESTRNDTDKVVNSDCGSVRLLGGQKIVFSPFNYSPNDCWSLKTTYIGDTKIKIRPEVILFNETNRVLDSAYENEKMKQIFNRDWMNIGNNKTFYLCIDTPRESKTDIIETLLDDQNWNGKRFS